MDTDRKWLQNKLASGSWPESQRQESLSQGRAEADPEEHVSMSSVATKANKSISIVIPALNEEAGIGTTIQSIPRKQLESEGYRVQILVVDNGSTDKTTAVATAAGAEVVSEPRRGYGRAYKTGFASASGQIVATSDADATYPVEDIPKLVDLLEKERLDFITTNRFAFMDKDAMPVLNKVGNRALNLFMRVLYRIRIEDSQSGFWVFRKSILERLMLRSDGMPFSEELKLEACYYGRLRWKECPIRYKARKGQRKLRIWRDGVQNLSYLTRKRVLR